MPKRVMAVDFGTRRIGLAWSDSGQTIAFPIGTYHQDACVEEIRIRAAEVADIVIGWPLTPQGKEEEAVANASAFERRLQRLFPEITFHRLDERFTSTLANRLLAQSGVKKSKKQEKALIDSAAACILLQNFLDRAHR